MIQTDQHKAIPATAEQALDMGREFLCACRHGYGGRKMEQLQAIGYDQQIVLRCATIAKSPSLLIFQFLMSDVDGWQERNEAPYWIKQIVNYLPAETNQVSPKSR